MTQLDLPGSPIVSARHMIVLPPRRPVLVHRPDDVDLPARPPITRAPAGALVAASILQSGQALLWMFAGMLMGIGHGGTRSGEPVAVVLVIAAILAFAVGCFTLALAVGMFGRSDVCRIASVVFQCVFGAIVLAGFVDVIDNHSAVGLTITLDPTSGPTFLISPGFLVILLSSCVATAVLLTCRQAATATRPRRRRQ
jgi:hypothetical protein